MSKKRAIKDTSKLDSVLTYRNAPSWTYIVSTIIKRGDKIIVLNKQDIIWLKRMLNYGAVAVSVNDDKNGTSTKIQKTKQRILSQLK